MKFYSPAQFRQAAELAFAAANPDATDAVVVWEFVGPLVPMKGADGKMRHGHFMVSASGYATRRMHACQDSFGFSVR